MNSKSLAFGYTNERRPRRSLLRAALWVYFAPIIVIGVLLLVMFGLALLAVPLGIFVEVMKRAGWH